MTLFSKCLQANPLQSVAPLFVLLRVAPNCQDAAVECMSQSIQSFEEHRREALDSRKRRLSMGTPFTPTSSG